MNKKILLSNLIIYLLFLPLVSKATITDEAKIIVASGSNLTTILKHTQRNKSISSQEVGMKKYINELIKNYPKTTTKQKYSINNFLVYGTKTTAKLSPDKRYELVKAFIKKYKKLPTTQDDWKKVLEIKIAGLAEKNCGLLADKLTNCTPYKCQYTFPNLRLTISYEIKGIENNKCIYVSYLPNNYITTCNYNETLRKAAAEYFNATQAGWPIETKAHVELGGENTIIYKIDVKELPDISKPCTTNKNE